MRRRIRSPRYVKHFIIGLLAAAALVAPGKSATAAGPIVPGLHYPEWREEQDRRDEADPKELRLLSYFFTRGTFTNQLADPAGLKGVSLGPIGIGANVGSGTRVGDKSEAYYIEQRWIPVISYSPLFVDDLATFRAQFEIDFMWGQAANQVQHNQGGGLNSDQVNIQTKNVNVALYPTRSARELAIIVGTQAAYDSNHDPSVTSLFDVVKTGYKLAFLGTDATGISAYADWNGLWKLSFFPFGAAQPDKATDDDGRFAFAYLVSADYAYRVSPVTTAGLSVWRLQDDTEGAAFAYEGLVKSGPGSTGLFPYTGVARHNIEAPAGGVTYLGAHFNHDINFRAGDVAASGFLMINAGTFDNRREGSALVDRLDVLGAAADLELMYNWGKTAGSVITLEGLLTTGDSNLDDGDYTGVFTMNNYGLPGAVWFNHKTLILFPFSSTVSNYTGAVVDISNQGYGLVTGILTVSHDVIPDKLNVKLGAAYAQTAVKPPPTAGGVPRGRTVGAEVNLEVKYHIRHLMTAGVHLAYLSLGNFYDGNTQTSDSPFAAFTTFTWYAF